MKEKLDHILIHYGKKSVIIYVIFHAEKWTDIFIIWNIYYGFLSKKNRIDPNPIRNNQNPNWKYQPEFNSQQLMKDKTIKSNSAYKSNREKLDYSTDAVFYLKCTAQRPILQITLLYMQNHSFEVLKMWKMNKLSCNILRDFCDTVIYPDSLQGDLTPTRQATYEEEEKVETKK